MKKIMIINLLLILIINSFSYCLAVENQTETVKHKIDCKLYLKYKGQYRQIHYAIFEKNGKEFPAYCLTPEYSGVGVNGIKEYPVDINKKITDENIWKVMINGYPYKSLEELGVQSKEEAYVATQAAIYTVLENRKVSDYEADNSPEGKRTLDAYLKIIENAKNSKNEMIQKIEILPELQNWEIDEKEIYCLSKVYSLKSNTTLGTYKVNLVGDNIKDLKITDVHGNEKNVFSINEKFKILSPIEILKDNIAFDISVEAELVSYPIFYGETTITKTQDYALTGENVENFCVTTQDILPKNDTKIKIIKQEKGINKRLEGVKFNLLNANNDSVIQNLATDKNGEILIENLFPGNYFLQEIETLDGYELIEEPIEIKIEFNDEKEIIVENNLKPKEIIYEEPIELPINVITENTVIEKRLPVTGY